MSHETKQRVIGGVRTSYLDVGDQEPIVALHGIPTSSALFAPLVPHLAGHRLLAPDLLGQGRTERPGNGKLDFAAYLRHLDAFLSEIAPATFHLLVHDFGAVLGLTWATGQVHRLKSVTVLSTTVTPSLRIAVIYAGNLLFGRAALRRVMPLTLRRASARSSPLSPLLDEWADPWTRPRLFRGLDHFSPRRLRELRARLPALKRPVLLLWGTDDDVFPIGHADVLRQILPDATLKTISRCGHWAPLDAPDEVAEHLRAFCAN